MGKKKSRGKKSLELTDGLITDIISRLPEKNLMRFTCVSKSWCSLIYTDSYLFHLRSQRTASRSRPFLILQRKDYGYGGPLYYNYWLELDLIEDANRKPRQLHNPFDHDNDCPRRDACVIGSCDGLLVLQQRFTRKMAVLNPTTKKHHVVPPNPAGDDNVYFRGFGYDHVHGCYKLVTRIARPSNDDHVVELMIYNVHQGRWKKSRFDGLDNECRLRLCKSGKTVDGALYWCDDMLATKILCFLLAEEEFHRVDPPYFDDDVVSSSTVFDGRLCLVCYKVGNRVELWLMECDYKIEVGSSHSPRWIELLVISDLEAIIPRCFDQLLPICFSACENKILS